MNAASLPELAQAPEVAEREAWADLCAAACGTAAAAQVSARRVGADGLAIAVPAVPLTLFNRVLGLGLRCLPDAAEIAALPALRPPATQPAASRWAVQPAPGAQEAALGAALAARGWTALPQRIAKMACELSAQPPLAKAPAGMDVRAVHGDGAAAFVQPIVQGMGLPPWFADWLRALPGRPGWHCYAAWHSGQPAAAAAMHVQQGGAWLGMATTLPVARHRGAQRALMQRRLADARARGCRIASSETGEPVPGQPHPSYSNMLGCGLLRVATRTSWVPPP